METTPYEYRRHLRCGWISGGVERAHPEARTERVLGEWRAPLVRRGVTGSAIGGELGPKVCPGYTIKLPQVREIARWWGWEKRGVLDIQIERRDLLVTEDVLDLADVFSSEAAQAESWETEQRMERARQNGGK